MVSLPTIFVLWVSRRHDIDMSHMTSAVCHRSVYRGWTKNRSKPVGLATDSDTASRPHSEHHSVYGGGTFSQTQKALRGQLDSSGVGDISTRQQQRILMDRLVLEQLAR